MVVKGMDLNTAQKFQVNEWVEYSETEFSPESEYHFFDDGRLSGIWLKPGSEKETQQATDLKREVWRIAAGIDKLENKNKLLPCPFCGSVPIWIHEVVPDGHYHIKCPHCHIVMKEDRRDKVIGMWNRRTKSETHERQSEESKES